MTLEELVGYVKRLEGRLEELESEVEDFRESANNSLDRVENDRARRAAPPSLAFFLDVIEAHLRSLGLRSRVSWCGGEWTVTLTSRKEEHQKTPTGRKVVGRSSLIEEAYARAIEEWEKK